MSPPVSPDPVETAIAVQAAKTFSPLLARLIGEAISAAADYLGKAVQGLSSSYTNHLQVTFDRCTKIKTIINADEPVGLLSIYVNTQFQCGARVLDDISLIEELNDKRHIVVSGTGGGGKTIFMKYLWLSLFENPKGRIPLFVELRRINDLTSDNLLVFIYHNISDEKSRISEEQFRIAVAKGLFVFVLDGFDEVIVEKREAVGRQIIDLARNNPSSIVVVSGRPDQRFDSWQSFSHYRVQPLDKKTVVALIGKLNYDKDIKKKFIARINQDLFSKHHSFLSTPLLASLMLLTFGQYADIPEKIHIFYDQAFDTLFARHDAFKEAFKRKMHSSLPIDVFKKILSYFCLISYHGAKFEFNEADAITLIRRAMEAVGEQSDAEKLLLDLIESVCVLQRDGVDITFTHRSFQEFFTANCLARFPVKRFRSVLQVFARRDSDNVIPMLAEMNEDIFEELYVLPLLQDIAEAISTCPIKDLVQKNREIFGDSYHIRIEKTIERTRDYRIELFGSTDFYYARLICSIHYKEIMGFAPDELEAINNTLNASVHKFIRSLKLRDSTLPMLISVDSETMKKGTVFHCRNDNALISVSGRSVRAGGAELDLDWFPTCGVDIHCAALNSRIFRLREHITQKRAKKAKILEDLFV